MIPPVVSIVAKSGTGKTTLLEKLIAELKARGYRVGAVKHDLAGCRLVETRKLQHRSCREGFLAIDPGRR